MAKYTLNRDQQVVEPKGGEYYITTTLNGGTALLEVQQSGDGEWVDLGTLTDTPQRAALPYEGKLRLTKTGAAIVEVSEWS